MASPHVLVAGDCTILACRLGSNDSSLDEEVLVAIGPAHCDYHLLSCIAAMLGLRVAGCTRLFKGGRWLQDDQ